MQVQAFASAVRRCLSIAIVVAAGTAQGDPAPPSVCKRCTLDVPKQTPEAGAPLLVVLHGDREQASTAAQRWRAATKDRGWVLLSLQCPVDDGCTGSWWQWQGNLGFLKAQIDKVAKTVKIDRTRIGLVGWSGGASFMGANAKDLRDYAGLVFHGGGMPAGEEGCSPTRQRAYFLVGDKNPLHRLAIALREHFDHCRADVVWDVIKNGDHDREDRALDRKKALRILDWISSAPATPAR